MTNREEHLLSRFEGGKTVATFTGDYPNYGLRLRKTIKVWGRTEKKTFDLDTGEMVELLELLQTRVPA